MLRLIVTVTLLLILAPPILFAADEHEHESVAGRFYEGWKMPNYGAERFQSCCNKHDCYATTIKMVKGRWYARRREDGEWIHVPDNKLEHNQVDFKESPDGLSHVCMPPHGGVVYCAVLGNQT